jgi:hypothetical protein
MAENVEMNFCLVEFCEGQELEIVKTQEALGRLVIVRRVQQVQCRCPGN